MLSSYRKRPLSHMARHTLLQLRSVRHIKKSGARRHGVEFVLRRGGRVSSPCRRRTAIKNRCAESVRPGDDGSAIAMPGSGVCRGRNTVGKMGVRNWEGEISLFFYLVPSKKKNGEEKAAGQPLKSCDDN